MKHRGEMWRRDKINSVRCREDGEFRHNDILFDGIGLFGVIQNLARIVSVRRLGTRYS